MLPLALLASAATAAFRPIQDRPYRYETDETRTVDGVERHFHSARTVVFHQNDHGFTATVTLVSGGLQSAADASRMFATATDALLNRPLRFALTADGSIEGVEDADGAIAQIATAIERMAAGTHRPGVSTALAAPLRAMSPERKVAMLASILSPLLAGHVTERAPGQVAVRLPSRPPLPPSMALSGTETLRHTTNGQTIMETDAAGNVATPPLATASDPIVPQPTITPSVVIHSIRTFDTLSGLLVGSSEVSDVAVSDGHAPRRTQIVTVTTVTPPR